MGLDNLPRKYACESLEESRHFAGETSLLVRGDEYAIDCASTQDKDGCPWKTEFDKTSFDTHGPTGMLGTDCWYRGKYGEYLLTSSCTEVQLSFYGSDDEGYLSPAYCEELAAEMAALSDDVFISTNPKDYDSNTNPEILKQDWAYAIWWLRFAADFCDGSITWY